MNDAKAKRWKILDEKIRLDRNRAAARARRKKLLPRIRPVKPARPTAPTSETWNAYTAYVIDKTGKMHLNNDRQSINWEAFLLSMKPGEKRKIQTGQIPAVLKWAGRYGIRVLEWHHGFESVVWIPGKGAARK